MSEVVQITGEGLSAVTELASTTARTAAEMAAQGGESEEGSIHAHLVGLKCIPAMWEEIMASTTEVVPAPLRPAFEAKLTAASTWTRTVDGLSALTADFHRNPEAPSIRSAFAIGMLQGFCDLLAMIECALHGNWAFCGVG